MSTPPAKRQRTEDVHAPITRSETWRSDGNVVLQAKNTQFRVHWSVLAMHSSVFHDMQGVPQPPDQPSIDGCPVVELFGDDPMDVEHLLRVLYTPAVPSPRPPAFTLQVIGALIRLGRKYNFKDLLDSAVACLMSEYPTTLEAFDAVRAGTTPSTIARFYGMEFDVLTMALENKILSVLPCVYYTVVEKFDLRTLFDGISREDGTRAHLSSLDLRRCVVGRESLSKRRLQPGYTLGWTRQWVYDDCTDLAECRRVRELTAIAYSNVEGTQVGALGKPYSWDRFCDTCIAHSNECMAAGRRKFWDELPEIFDLLPWNELKNDI
ncbi:hypothetical protein K438DRAFT_1703912 [Mycena galopus ATCC 62051]|nr:hypothetical protein K438DRAFT_1703912 [Mycena galopus ATCC 62051]